jgi:hypothetical protein
MGRNFAYLLVVLTAGAGAIGCGATCDTSDEGNVPSAHEDGTTVNGYYFSSESHGRLLHFPGGRRYDIYHHLGFEPILVQLYWSFAEVGVGTTDQTDRSTLSAAAGNSAEIQLKNDRYIRVKNDSCAEYWLLVVASGDPRVGDAGPGGGDEGGAGDAGAAGRRGE